LKDEEEEDALHSVRRLVRDLQDEVDTQTGLLAAVKLPTLGSRPSGARILGQPKLRSRQNVLAVAAWALSNMVANNPANQDAARQALLRLQIGCSRVKALLFVLGCAGQQERPKLRKAMAGGCEVLGRSCASGGAMDLLNCMTQKH